MRNSVEKSLAARSFRLLAKRDRKKLLSIVSLHILSGLLDLAGVVVVGALGALAVNGVQSRVPGDRVSKFLQLTQIENYSFQTQVAMLGFLAAFLMVSRTVLSIFFTRKTLYFLSRRSAAISSTLVSQLVNQPLLWIRKRTSQQTLYAVTDGVSSIMVGIIGNLIGLLSDFSLLAIMLIGLFALDPIIAFGTLITFSTIGGVIYGVLHRRAHVLGNRNAELTIETNEKVIEMLSLYRELVVRNRREYYSRLISTLRYRHADTLAEASFMPNISKYVIEMTIVFGALVLSAIQFTSQDATRAVATLSVFMAAGLRIAPAVLRVQQSALSLRGAMGIAMPTLELIEDLRNSPSIPEIDDHLPISHQSFIPRVEVSDLNLSYPDSKTCALNDISFVIEPGELVAIVGTSGAGKTSLVDSLLGIIIPDSGAVTISGLSPELAVMKWPGAIAYVSQDVVISSGTVKSNVALGYPDASFTEEQVTTALESAHLKDFITTLPHGIHTDVGERGTKLSGGQRQRLGIARALFTNPKLLILDEATSSLDSETELNISETIQELKGAVTVITIAHRLSTIRNADRIFYMSEGKILASGTFDQVRLAIPDFDLQARLMGL